MGSQLMRIEVGESIWTVTLLTMPVGAAFKSKVITCLSATLVDQLTYLLMAFEGGSQG